MIDHQHQRRSPRWRVGRGSAQGLRLLLIRMKRSTPHREIVAQ
jgi:hypothetical protein